MKTIIENLQNQILETRGGIMGMQARRKALKEQERQNQVVWSEIERLFDEILKEQRKLTYLRQALVSVYYAAGHMSVDVHEPEMYVTMNL